MYATTRDSLSGMGLFSQEYSLWYRDSDFIPPYAEPDGSPCFWSRGNGWAIAALVRVLDVLPPAERHRNLYVSDFTRMCNALVMCQRKDGFWNPSLLSEANYGGKETTGTSMFAYAMAWGIRNGILSKDDYMHTLSLAWNALASEAVRTDGSLAYVQGTGRQPSDAQPVTYDVVPDFEDFAVGCFLLAASEVAKLAEEQSK